MERLLPTWRVGVAALVLISIAGCTGAMMLLGAVPSEQETASPTDEKLAVSVAEPATAVTAVPGIAAVIRWADIASQPGTTVRVSAQRQSTLLENIGDPINLIGDGRVGVGRDALADGDNDVFLWDIAGVRVGDYVVTVTLDAPDGRSVSASSRDEKRGTSGLLRVTTSLVAPTLSFTAPAATDVTVNVNNTFNITWNDNGNANSAAILRLGLDPDSSAVDKDHKSGNEITLLADDPLSTSGNAGQFTFAFLDAENNAVPLGTYTAFAVVDDNAHDPVIVSATGRLILAP